MIVLIISGAWRAQHLTSQAADKQASQASMIPTETVTTQQQATFTAPPTMTYEAPANVYSGTLAGTPAYEAI